MKPSTLSLLPILFVAASCGGSGANGDASVVADDKNSAPAVSVPSNNVILGMAYNTDYSVPEGFFVDERSLTTTRSYTVHHVLDPSSSYELCSNDPLEAQAWEQADNDSRAVGGYFVTSYENDRYFEFVRELSYDQDVGNVGDPTSPGYARVFKCDHTNRDGVDRAMLDGYSGVLSAAVENEHELREFTEYLWQFRFFNVTRKVVLDSYSSSQDGDMGHTLLLAFVVNQGNNACDLIDVVEWRFIADAVSGEVMREFDTVHSFTAINTNGIARVCD